MTTGRMVVAVWLAIVITSGSLCAQTAQNRERGFAADKLYQFGNIDTVNLFNGNLILSIPIGQTYAVSPALSYFLALRYNASVWEYAQRCYPIDIDETMECLPYALPSPLANAGLGWSVSLGALLPPGSPYNHSGHWVYASPDDGRHVFLDGSPSPNVVTHDGSRLRLRDTGAGIMEVDSPDGVTRRFEASGEIRRPLEFRDRFSAGTPGSVTTNFVRISYNDLINPVEAGAETWRIIDSAGRTQKLYFRSGVQDHVDYSPTLLLTNGGHLPQPRSIIAKVDLTAFAGADTYTFDYDAANGEIGTTIARDNEHDWDQVATQPEARVALLRAVHLPDGTAYTMERPDPAAPGGVTPDYEKTNDTESSGVLYSLTLPTRGKLAWTYARREYPDPGDNRPSRPKSGGHDFQVDSLAVTSRTLTDPISNSTSVWQYTAILTPIPLETCPVGTNNPNFRCHEREMVVTVTDPLSIRTENFFSTCVDWLHQAAGWTPVEYGRPLTHTDTSVPDRWLSTRILKTDGSGVQRSTYIAYERDPFTEGTNGFNLELRLKATTNVFNDDSSCPACWVDSASSDYDGYGHYRKVTTTTSFPAVSPLDPVARTSFTDYNGGTQANGEASTEPDGRRAGVPAFTPSDPWVLDTFTEQRTSVIPPHPVNTPGTEIMVTKSLFDFEPATGFLRRKRTLLGDLQAKHDLLTVFEYDPNVHDGNVSAESYYGGDSQQLDDVHYYPAQIALSGPPAYRVEHAYSAGVLSRSTYMDGTAEFLTTLDLTINSATGLVEASRDAVGLETLYLYGPMGRLTQNTPPSGPDAPNAPTVYTYNNATATSGASVDIVQLAGASPTHATMIYDGFGKVVREATTLPGGDSVRLTEYNGNGWKTRVSEQETVPAHFTVFEDFDALGRPHTIRAPDSTPSNPRITTVQYDGDRKVQRTISVATSGTGAESPATTTEISDWLGRLRQIDEPSGGDGHLVSTFYQYDGADHPIEVKTVDGAVSQARAFAFDRRGFLLSERNPEKGMIGNGMTLYMSDVGAPAGERKGGYDARGHLLRKREEGSTTYDQDFFYDRAERLTAISEHSTGRAVKEYAYDRDRVSTTVRHNYTTSLGDTAVTTHFLYDAAGRISYKQTVVGSGPSFLQHFAYTALGAANSLSYPGCTGCGAASLPGREISLGYTNGLLTSVNGYADAITYWPNGMMHTVAHSNGVVDTQEIDPATGMARPLSIAFNGYCVGPSVNTAEPADKPAASGGTATLTVTAQAGLTYQWYTGTPENGMPISGATTTTFTTPELTANATYWVRISNATCSTDSRVAKVTVKSCDEISILTQPLDDFIGEGESRTLAVAVNVPAGLTATFQWYRGFRGDTTHPVGMNEATYPTGSLAATTHYWVRVRVVGGTCAVDSVTATIVICTPPVITGTPLRNQAVSAPASGTVPVTLSVAATGERLTYAWYAGANTVPTTIPDNSIGHNPQLTIFYAPADAGAHDYYVVVGNTGVPTSCSGSVRADATVMVYACNLNPSIWPPAGTVYPGATTFTLTVGENQVAPHTIYKWHHGIDGADAILTGFTTGSMTVGLASVYDAFWCEVSVPALVSGGTPLLDGQMNPVIACQATTPKAYVKLLGSCPLPPLTAGPVSQVVTPGDNSKTFVASVDWPDVTYQWYAGSSGDTRNPIAGATGKVLPVPSIAQTYWCRVTDECGTLHLDSQTLALLVNNGTTCSPVVINHQPQPADIASGTNVMLQVDANATSNLTYQWFQSGTSIPLGNGPSVTVHPTITSSYYALIGQTCGGLYTTVTTVPATVHVRTCNGISIDNQPGNIVVVAGTAGSLHIDASSAAAISYQWYAGENGDTSAPVAGGTSATVTVSPSQTTSYWVRLTTSSCTIDSASATTTVCHPPAINFVSGANPLLLGQSTTLNANATGTSLTYQWYTGASGSTVTPIVNATGPSITVSPLNLTTYWVRVTGLCGAQDSAVVTVTVCALPVITTQPHDVTIFSGATTALSVVASQGTSTPLTYQWYRGLHGDVSHPAGTGASFTTPALTEDASYWVSVGYGNCGPVESQTATVSLCPYAATLAAPGASVTNTTFGQSVLLTENVNGAPQFLWYEGASGDTSHPLGDWQANSFITVAPTATKQYWVEVRNTAGACIASSLARTINVCIPAITTQPAPVMINAGQSTTLSVVANTAGLTYQWYVGTSPSTTTPISGATGSSVTVSPSTSTSYWVKVTGSCGVAANSSTALVTICAPAAITPQPQGSSIVRGQSTTVSVTATGTNLTYQWYQGLSGNTGAPVFGNTSFITVSPQNPIDYWVKVTAVCGSSQNSATAHISVCLTPAITTQPQNTSVFSGSAATLSVTASETTSEPMHYQWFKGVSGPVAVCSDSATCNTGALTAQTQFWVRVTAGSCTVDSSAATVSICPLPASVTGPANANSSPGQTVRLQFGALSGATAYAWYRGNSGDTSFPLSGGFQSANYFDVSPSVTTNYWAQVQNGSCVSSSTTTTVSVCIPVITAQPAGSTVTAGNSATLSVTSNLSGSTYQWYIGASGTATSPISGATSASVTVSPSSTTSYWCKVSGSCGFANSNAATITVCSPPAITQQPANASPSYRNYPTGLGVVATGTSLTYQWYIGVSGNISQPMSGQTSATLTFNAVNSGQYWVKVSGMCGSVNSNTAWISVYPVMTQQPAAVALSYGSTASFTVAASGTYLHYTWRLGNGQPAPGGTDSPAYSSGSIYNNTGFYCDITSSLATTMSNAADATLCDGPGIVSMPVTTSGSCRNIVVNADRPIDSYLWYQGPRGNTTSLVAQGSNEFWICPGSSTTYWCRLVAGGCYTDSPAVTVP
jgi:Ig-like domain CHU_C associated